MERKTSTAKNSKTTAKTCCTSNKAMKNCGGHCAEGSKRKSQASTTSNSSRQPRTKSCS